MGLYIAKLKQLVSRADLIQLQCLTSQMHLRKHSKRASTSKFHAQTQGTNSCHLQEHMRGFSKKSHHGPLKIFISQRHTALARQEAEPPQTMVERPHWGPVCRRKHVTSSAGTIPLFGTAIWIPKHKTGPLNCTRLNVTSVQRCPGTLTSCLP